PPLHPPPIPPSPQRGGAAAPTRSGYAFCALEKLRRIAQGRAAHPSVMMAKPLELPASPRILTFVSEDTIEIDLARLPYLVALRHASPRAQVTWFAGRGPSSFRGDLIPLAHGLIDRIVDTVPLSGRLTDLLVRPLAGQQFDLVIDGQRGVMTALALKRIHASHFLSAAGDFFLS